MKRQSPNVSRVRRLPAHTRMNPGQMGNLRVGMVVGLVFFLWVLDRNG